MSEVTKAEALQERVIEGNEDLALRLPADNEFKLRTSFLYSPEGSTYSGEAVTCTGYGFFKGGEISNEDLYALAGAARDKIKDNGGEPLVIKVYVAPVQNFRRKFYELSKDWRPVKITWTFHGSPFPWVIIPLIIFGVAAVIGTIGFLVVTVRSTPEQYSGAIEAIKGVTTGIPSTAKWLALGVGAIALLGVFTKIGGK